jgi:hypothetical protein
MKSNGNASTIPRSLRTDCASERITISSAVKSEGEINGKPKQCASAASYGAQASSVTCGEVGSSNLSDRVIKRFGNIGADKPIDANHIGSVTAQDGTRATSTVGDGSYRIATGDGTQDNRLGSCQADYVGSRAQKDRCVSTSEMGKVEGSAVKGCIDGCNSHS